MEEIQIELNISDESQEATLVPPRKRKGMVAPRKLKKNNSISSLDRVEVALQDLNKIAKVSSSVSEDELDHFGKYVTASLRKLPSINAIRCQQKFQNIITEERLSVLSETEQRTSTPLLIESSTNNSSNSFSFHNTNYSEIYSTTATNSSDFSSNVPKTNYIQLAMLNAFDDD